MDALPISKPLGASSLPERTMAIVALAMMSLLPVCEAVMRQVGGGQIPGSSVLVQHLTLWVAFLGAALAASSDRLLGLSANTLLPEKWAAYVRIAVSALAAAISSALCLASLQFVLAERQAGAMLGIGIPKWVAMSAMPVGFFLIAIRAANGAAESWKLRALAAAGLFVPVLLLMAPNPSASGWLAVGIPLVIGAALLGLPIFATLGGLALLLFWHSGLPLASVPVEAYRLVASPVLPSLPLFTLAGFLLVEGGASARLLRVFNALFGWMPGGLAITTAVGCALFTWAGSGVTILSMGGLLVPMLVKARYPERFAVGLVNGSGSLGLLFPPSLPVILYAIYAQVDIKTLFIGGSLPGLLLVAMVCAYGVIVGERRQTARSKFVVSEARAALWEAKWELVLPFLVLVGLFGGLGTLTEASAVTAVYAFIVEAFVMRGFSPVRDFGRVAFECVVVVGGVLLIIGVAMGLTSYLVTVGVPDTLADWVQTHIHSKYVFLALLNLLLLVKGSFMDVFSAIVIMAPLLRPIAAMFGIDPIQLGIIFIANLELGYLTPPVGINLCLSAYRFNMPLPAVYRATLPFYLILLAGVLLLTYVPQLTMWPVQWFGR